MTPNELRLDQYGPPKATDGEQAEHVYSGLGKSNAEIQQIYDAFAPQYRRVTWVNEHLFGVKWLRRRLLQQASGRILDVAAGTGENFSLFPESAEITAVDLSPGMLAEAERQAEAMGRVVKTAVMDAAALQFADASFDTVVSTLSTCTFANPVAVLQEMKRVCKPDGRILLLEHGRSRVGWIGRYQDRTAHSHFRQAGCRWNQEPQKIVRAAGLSILSHQRAFFGVFHAMVAAPT
jgi:ubiquinone/menaquinone biosynthesis C-methylase UbiE